MNRKYVFVSAVAVVCCIMLLFPLCAYAQETCYIRFSRLSVNELVSSDKSFELAYSRTSYLKQLDADHGADTHFSLAISGKKLRICVTGKNIRSVRPYGLSASLNRTISAKKNKVYKKISISGLKNGFFSAGLYVLFMNGSSDRFNFYLEKTGQDSFFYSPGQYYNDELIDSAISWYNAVGREEVNAAYTANVDPKIAERASQLAATRSDDAEKAECIYDWIISNFNYDYEYSVYDPVICFREKRGVCNALAELYTIMCNSAGIPCLLVYGESIDQPLMEEKTSTVQNHAWVLIYTDGRWRYCDPTWDIGNSNSEEYFMMSSTQSGIDHIAFSAFIPDSTSNTALFFHEWGGCTVDRAATDTADGHATYTCTKCGLTKSVVIPSKKSR